MKHILTSLIYLYKIFLSPILPKSCRFYPVCSDYAIESLNRYGFIKGSWLSLRRLLRCHPFHPGGYDPVP
ncbi:MAG: membrane protein insertion efficiency factor YidD [Nitrospirae bacterium]|nr:MAG: membrane protein insertion efficiency factor YidD [Nitrospirota bacterium]